MIRCGAFCLTSDMEHARIAEASANEMDRATDGEPVTADSGEWTVRALPLGRGAGLPVVHGWVAPEPDNGEFSMLSQVGGTLVASRDCAGTRPLYVSRSGKWVASDHRFFPGEEGVLLPPGSSYDVRSGAVTKTESRSASASATLEDAGSRLARLVERAVEERVAGRKRVAVAFSGGLDSSVLASCAKRHSKVVACAVHTKGSRDSASARSAADALGVELLEQEVDAGVVDGELSAMDLPFQPSRMDRALWCIYSIASRSAADSDAEVILLGQLADELFGGYAKYERVVAEQGPGAAAAMMEADLAGCGTRGFLRDEVACSRWIEPLFPFADRRVVAFGRGLPVAMKIRKGVRKAALREAAVQLGLPSELSGAAKKAAQYSSGVQKLIA